MPPRLPTKKIGQTKMKKSVVELATCWLFGQFTNSTTLSCNIGFTTVMSFIMTITMYFPTL